jgi:hypothetical protein
MFWSGKTNSTIVWMRFAESAGNQFPPAIARSGMIFVKRSRAGSPPSKRTFSQLELREKYGRQKADTLTREIAQRLPKDADVAEAKKYAAQYREAAADFAREKETFGGVWGILKSLMLIQPKQPEERVRDQDRQRLQRPAV